MLRILLKSENVPPIFNTKVNILENILHTFLRPSHLKRKEIMDTYCIPN